MNNLTINIIPFKHPSIQKEFGFYTEKKEGYFPIHRTELPNELWDNQKEEVVKHKYYYTNFEDIVDKPGKVTHLRRMKLTRVNELPRFDLSLG